MEVTMITELIMMDGRNGMVSNAQTVSDRLWDVVASSKL